jgi:hypothetical protein
MLGINRPAFAACVLSAVLVPLSGGCLSVPPPPGGYIQVNQAPPAAPVPAPVTPSGEAEPTPEPAPVAQGDVSLPEDPALVEDNYADLELGDAEAGRVLFPPNATVVNGGPGDLWFKATAKGKVFVYDTEARRVVASARLEEGQSVQVRPGRGVVTVDGEAQFLQCTMDRRHKHQVLFAEWDASRFSGNDRGDWGRDDDDRRGYRGRQLLRESIDRAKVVARGSGDVSFWTKSKGVLYVRDLTTGKIVRMVSVPARVRVTVDPRQDVVKTSKGTIWPTQLVRTHAHALLWDERGADNLEEMFRAHGTARVE